MWLIITFLFVDNKAKIFILLGSLYLAMAIFIVESTFLTHFLAYDLSDIRVHPEPEIVPQEKKKIYTMEGDES